MLLSRAARYPLGPARPLGTGDAAQAPALGAVHDKAGAPGGAAAARMQRPLGEGEAVVEGELGTRGDVAARGDPHAAADHLDATVWGARVVDKTGNVAARAAVEVVATREVEDVNGVVAAAALAGEALRLAAGCLGLGNPFAGLFDHGRPVRDQLARVDSTAVDGGLPGSDPA